MTSNLCWEFGYLQSEWTQRLQNDQTHKKETSFAQSQKKETCNA